MSKKLKLILFFIQFFCLFFTKVFVGYSQYEEFINNDDSLRKYLQMKEHPAFEERPSAIYLYNELIEKLNRYGTGIGNFDNTVEIRVAIKVFNVKDNNELFEVQIPYYKGVIKVKSFSGSTINLEDGKIVRSIVDERNFDKTTVSEKLGFRKLVMPNVKEGSIIEYRLRFKFNAAINNYLFQTNLPSLFSKFEFKFDPKDWNVSYDDFFLDSVSRFEIRDKFEASNQLIKFGRFFENGTSSYIWTRRNTQEFIEEKFASSNKREYVSINLQTREDFVIGNSKKSFNSNRTWKENNDYLFNNVYADAFKSYSNLKIDSSFLLKDEKDSLIIAKKLYYDFINNFELITDEDYSGSTFFNVFNKKKGNRTELKKVLCAIYRHLGFSCDLLLISTNRDKPLYPDSNNYFDVNRVAVRVFVNGQAYLIDPSQKDLPFGYLPYSYYNGHTWVLNRIGGWLFLDPIMAKDVRKTDVIITPIDSSDKRTYKISYHCTFGYYSSIQEREDFKDSLEFQEYYKKVITHLYPTATFKNVIVECKNQNSITHPFEVNVDAEVNFQQLDDVLVIDPYLYKIFGGENPFKTSKKRLNDIELDYFTIDKYSFKLKADNNSKIEDYPKSIKIQFGDPSLISVKQVVVPNKDSKSINIQFEFINKPAKYSAKENQELSVFFDDLISIMNNKFILKY